MNRRLYRVLQAARIVTITSAAAVACSGCAAFQSQMERPLAVARLPGGGRVELSEVRTERPGRSASFLHVVWADHDGGSVFASSVPDELDTAGLRLAVDAGHRRAWVFRPGETVFSVDAAAQREWEYGQPQPEWALPE